MDIRTILFALHEMEDIGWKSIRSIVQRFADLREILHLRPEQLGFGDLPLKKAYKICASLTPSFVQHRLSLYNDAGVRFVTIFDEEYPELLKQTAQPPWLLYYIGDIALAHIPLLAVVGTRTPTAYGRKVAEDLSHSLAQLGLGVVSGLARGIDSAAHKGALKAQGSTIAVLGCAVDRVYPPENVGLQRQIADRGLVLSEYPIGTPAHPGLFPMRNRIIAGLALGTIVVEAAARSGSLITADLAMEESRDVFAVPGAITSPKSQGTLALIKQGAKLVSSVEDIIEEYKDRLITSERNTYIKTEDDMSKLTAEEQNILDLLSTIPSTIDQLLEQSKFEFGHLHSILLSLLIKNKIQQLPGSNYTAL